MAYERRRAAVTGGSGFIGTHLTRELTSRGYSVYNLDLKEPDPATEGLQHYIQCDLSDAGAVLHALKRISPDTIYNLAAVADISVAAEGLEVNHRGIRHIMEAADQLPDPKPRIVHVSTQLVCAPGARPKSEDDYYPYTSYGRSKAESEEVLRRADWLSPWVVARPTNVWGPKHPTFADEIWKYLAKGYYLHPSGPPVIRSYGYVANVAFQLAQLATLSLEAVASKTYYVGDAPIDSAEWVDAFSFSLRGAPARRCPRAALRAAAYLGDVLKGTGLPAPIDSGRYYRMTTDYRVPMAESLSVLGRGEHSLRDGVDATVAWIKERHASGI